jgi:CBS domain containing-hemolysin-like protein
MIAVIYIIIIAASVFMAGLFAGAETGMYQLNLLRLRLGIERKQLSFVLLGKLFDNSPSLLISTLLGTSLAQYVATSIITFLLLERFSSEYTAELSATLIAAPLLFIFSDLIPKNLFFHRSDSLMPYVSYVLFAINKLFNWLGIVPLIRAILKLFAGPAAAAPFLRAHINSIRFPYLKKLMYDIETQNLLSPTQIAIIDRLSQIGNLTIASVMTPLPKVQMLDLNAGSDKSVLLNNMQNFPFTRWPVFDKSHDNITGYINILDCINSDNPSVKLSDFIRPLGKLNAETTITEATNLMRNSNQKIMLVVKPGAAEKPLGIVTMKDLAEELVGELAEW